MEAVKRRVKRGKTHADSWVWSIEGRASRDTLCLSPGALEAVCKVSNCLLRQEVSNEQKGSTQVQICRQGLSHIQTANPQAATPSPVNNAHGSRIIRSSYSCIIRSLYLLIKGNINRWIANSLKIVFTLPKYSTVGSGTFQIEMTCLIQRESKTPFNFLGEGRGRRVTEGRK